jgi:hypothetical protein
MNSIDGGYNKHYSIEKQYHDTNDNWLCEEQARKCNQCGESTIVTYNLRTHEVETYDLDDSYPDQKTKHRHPADNITKASVISAIAVEKRYLFERRPGDYDPFLRRIMK